jgi:hypothetical protein
LNFGLVKVPRSFFLSCFVQAFNLPEKDYGLSEGSVFLVIHQTETGPIQLEDAHQMGPSDTLEHLLTTSRPSEDPVGKPTLLPWLSASLA